jgi:hypothetical protein
MKKSCGDPLTIAKDVRVVFVATTVFLLVVFLCLDYVLDIIKKLI